MTSPSRDTVHINLLHLTSMITFSFISSAANLSADKILLKVTDYIIKDTDKLLLTLFRIQFQSSTFSTYQPT